MKIAVIQGPNLNLLGIRDIATYGPATLEDIHANMQEFADQNNIEIEFFQSNLEGEIVDNIQECIGRVDGVLINPAAYSHSSLAIKDALDAVGIPVVEVHISNIYKREEYRKKSITAESSTGVISGFGPFGYHLGLLSLLQIITNIEALKEAQEEAQADAEERVDE
jgi:3-dehydroquinate dehydratase-2